MLVFFEKNRTWAAIFKFVIAISKGRRLPRGKMIFIASRSDVFIIERSFENCRKYRPNISMPRDAFPATECGAEAGKFMSGIRLHVYRSGMAACSGR